MPQIQYASDLHLEFFSEEKLPSFETLLKPVAPILVLAGDIGHAGAKRTCDFLAWCSTQWRHVLWVFGNHEYYNHYDKKRWPSLPAGRIQTMKEREEAARATLPANVRILQGELVEIEGVQFYGATLWTHVSDEVNAAHGAKVADFKCIATKRDADGAPIAITNTDRNELHARHLDSLNVAVDAATPEKPLIIITHHLPTGALAPAIYHGEPTNPYYSNELWDLLRSGKVGAWICGHSHGRSILEKPTRCVLNARGYPREQTPENPYSTTAVISVSHTRSSSTRRHDIQEGGAVFL